MLFVIYGILLIGGMWLVGVSFAVPGIAALVFILGVLCIAAAVAVPITASRFEMGPGDR